MKNRIEVTGLETFSQLREFRNYIGGFTESIQFVERAFMPDGDADAMKRLLDKAPIAVDAVVDNTAADNASVSEADNEIRFRKADESTKRLDMEYIDAVNSGDMATAQRMVDEAAKRAGYTTMAFKGMLSNDWRTGKAITTIRSANGDWAGFFSNDKAVAEKFRNAFATMGEARTFSVYLDMSGADVIDANGQLAREMQFDNVSPVDSSPQLLTKIKESSQGLIIEKHRRRGKFMCQNPHIKSSSDSTRQRDSSV